MRPAARVKAAPVAALLAITLASCGLPDDGPPRVIAPEDVPHGLRDVARDSPLPRHRPSDPAGPVVYFVSRTGLVEVELSPPARGRTIEHVLAALAGGPSGQEQDAGLGTAIPPGIRLRLARATGSLAVVDLGGDAAHSDPELTRRATAQIVLTVTAVEPFREVVLTREGEPLAAPLPHGDLATRPVTAEDYAPMVAPDADVDEP